MKREPIADIALELRSGPNWESFERLRLAGPDGLRQGIEADQTARLNVKGDEFVIMRAETFSELYGLAQEVSRLGDGLRLLRQAVALFQATGGSELAAEHLCDLASRLPVLVAAVPPAPQELVFEEDERADVGGADLDFELDPTRIERPQWPGD